MISDFVINSFWRDTQHEHTGVVLLGRADESVQNLAPDFIELASDAGNLKPSSGAWNKNETLMMILTILQSAFGRKDRHQCVHFCLTRCRFRDYYKEVD